MQPAPITKKIKINKKLLHCTSTTAVVVVIVVMSAILAKFQGVNYHNPTLQLSSWGSFASLEPPSKG